MKVWRRFHAEHGCREQDTAAVGLHFRCAPRVTRLPRGRAAEFLDSIEVDNLFLVGDIVDLWSLRRSFYWPQEHNDVLRAILGKARAGTRVIYIPGNHDEDMREFCGSVFGNLQIRRDYVHVTAAGARTAGDAWR